MSDDSFELYDLRVEVVAPEGATLYCGAKPGDYFELKGEMLHLPPGQGFSIYSLAALLPLGPIYLGGVALVAALLVYEQSLVSEHDLSQVKRAFDLNGWVGILYFLTTGMALYVG